ncbi:branched-chain amino acid ABC transporter ATP-binding protein/permease [Pseudonocardia adelaidensis]|uniref:ABC transporter domain-containing protein n=1 Tax=Pseudonocardia adelaidensis TaxID=648754 RepID=A0ABP9NDI2_9PSEU
MSSLVGTARGTLYTRLVGAEVVALAVLVVAFTLPKLTASPFVLFFTPTVIVAVLATLHVWLLLRVDLLSFASPSFMAVGGYSAALTASRLTDNAVVLAVLCFAIPALVALPIGAMVLRLRGTYFALVTFVLAQVTVLLVQAGPAWLGGNSGISGFPPARLGESVFAARGPLLRYSVVLGIVGVLVVVAVTLRWRRHFAGIKENEPLAASLGLRPWLYKTLAFAAGAGIAGLAGLVLVNQIGNAHPDSFSPFMAVNHVAGAVVGGSGSILGPIVGAGILSWLTHTFAEQAEYAQLLLGAVLVVVVLVARDGVTGLVASAARAARGLVDGAERARARGPADDAGEAGLRPERAVDARPDEPALLEVTAVSKRFGGVTAVSGVSFGVAPGEVLGVIGPNGAGKTTLVNVLAGQLPPSGGTVRLAGDAITGLSPGRLARKGISRSYQQTSVFAGASVRENLERARAYGTRWIDPADLHRLLARMGLADRLDDRAGDLPYGLQKSLGLVLALAVEPRVLLLDEPAAGLERSERRRVDEVVAWAVDRGCAVLLVEHDMDLVRRICDRVLVMDTGEPLAAGLPGEVLADPRVISAYLGEPEDAPGDQDDSRVPTGGGVS